jgi:monoamine oxidase
LGGLGAIAAAGLAGGSLSGCASPEIDSTHEALNGGGLDVGIVGAGLAGLCCADQLRAQGIIAQVYEGNTRIGGRQWSQAGYFPGQVIERGGELIDTSQKNMINYARSFGLTLEDYLKAPGDTFYNIDGVMVAESSVVDDYRNFVAAMGNDLRQISAAPTADVHTAYDVLMDQMSLDEYLSSRGASRLLHQTVAAAYVGEYGREIEYQSALNFLLYIRANRRSKFQPFGTSDQRYHIVEGNDGIAKGLYARVQNQVTLGLALVGARKTANGRIELSLNNGGKTVTRTHDVVVIAIPFTVLRGLSLDASLGIPGWKTQAIQELGYGTNAKNMVGFNGRPWADQGSNGMAYATLSNLQNAWETSWTTATASSAVMTNFTGGALGAAQDPSKIQAQTAAFLADFDKVYPGAAALASRDKTGYRAQMMAWPQNPWSRGSYTCYLTGQFTSIAGNEGKPVGNLYFAGEHTDSFYNQQGFMEGALASGINAAAAILAAVKKAA